MLPEPDAVAPLTWVALLSRPLVRRSFFDEGGSLLAKADGTNIREGDLSARSLGEGGTCPCCKAVNSKKLFLAPLQIGGTCHAIGCRLICDKVRN